MKKKRIRCMLKNLSPLHIGCDEVYEPTGFSLDEENDRLVIFDPLEFIAELDTEDRERFSSICMRGTISSILEIYKFLHNRPARGRHVGICRGFKDHYKHVLKLPQDKLRNELNRFRIERTASCPSDHRPYIPGSAVKGALRTAYLNILADKAPDYSRDLRALHHQNPKAKLNKWLEEKLLGLDRVPPKKRISMDPFRLVKVSDFMPVGDISAKIIYAVNRKKKPSDKDARGPSQILETIAPGAYFVGEIMVDAPQDEAAVSHVIDMETLLECAGRFYEAEKEREDKNLKSIGAPIPGGAENGYRLIRLGRHSGAESVTIRRYRDIKIMLGKGKKTFEDHATTLWLASDTSKPTGNASLSPFGWIALSPLTAETEARLASEEKAFQEKRVRELREKGEKRRTLALRKKEEEKREQERKRLEEEKKKAEEKRKAAWENMSPAERVVSELKAPGIVDNRAFEIYREMSGFEEAERKMVASALKEYWIAKKKWKKRDCSNKQWRKVLDIKAILGEE